MSHRRDNQRLWHQAEPTYAEFRQTPVSAPAMPGPSLPLGFRRRKSERRDVTVPFLRQPNLGTHWHGTSTPFCIGAGRSRRRTRLTHGVRSSPYADAFTARIPRMPRPRVVSSEPIRSAPGRAAVRAVGVVSGVLGTGHVDAAVRSRRRRSDTTKPAITSPSTSSERCGYAKNTT